MRVSLVILLFSMAAPLAAQDLPKGEFPDGWKVRTDRANQSASEVVFVEMTPGWHVTTGPSAIMYNPSMTATGEYRIESESFLFDPGTRNEAYGFFFGGRNLDGAEQAYSYFLIRRTGEYLVKRRSGSETADVVGWTAHPAILKYDDRGDGATAKNVLAVEVGAGQVRFFVNGREVASVSRAQLDIDGVVGLRVNHGINVHIGSLKVEAQ